MSPPQVNIGKTGIDVSHTSTLVNNDKHRLDGTASVTKHFHTPGLVPDKVSGQLDYQHKPSNTSAYAGADQSLKGMGTDVHVGGKVNLYENKSGAVDLNGQYGRHFGGPQGTSKPNYGVFLRGSFKF